MKTTNYRIPFFLYFLFAALFLGGIHSCKQGSNPLNSSRISEAEIIAAQKEWGTSLIAIGAAYEKGGDYKATATKHLNTFYGFEVADVVVKPAIIKDTPFRTNFDEILSYYIGGNERFPEDSGFALHRWTNFRWDNVAINNQGSIAVATGTHHLTDINNEKLQLDYLFSYIKDEAGKVKIISYKSSLPYPDRDKSMFNDYLR